MSITPESVQKLLDSEDYGDRIKGLNQLRYLEPKIAFAMVQPLVTDSNARIRYGAVSQLDTLGTQDLKVTLELLRNRIHCDTEADVQAAAADVIGGLKITEAFEDLQELYHRNSDWLIQVSIVATLGEFGDPRGFELLKDALNSENELIKTTAISALGELGNKEAIPLLLPLARHEDWQIRYRLAQALGRLDGEKVRETLEKLAQDPMEQVAQEAKNNLN
jgi:HEAT repeat protein